MVNVHTDSNPTNMLIKVAPTAKFKVYYIDCVVSKLYIKEAKIDQV